jgi:hypothetical protein
MGCEAVGENSQVVAMPTQEAGVGRTEYQEERLMSFDSGHMGSKVLGDIHVGLSRMPLETRVQGNTFGKSCWFTSDRHHAKGPEIPTDGVGRKI